jgi:hypothetical protein
MYLKTSEFLPIKMRESEEGSDDERHENRFLRSVSSELREPEER